MSKLLFAQRFKRSRMVAGLKACELARSMGVTQGYVSQIESGKRENVSKDLLLIAAKEMNVSAEWLLTGIGPPLSVDSEINKMVDGNLPKSACPHCAAKDAEIADLRQQVKLLIQTNAALAAKPSAAAGPACGAVDGGRKERRGA